MTQPGETDGYSARKHLEAIRDHAPQFVFDYVVLNNRPVSDLQAEIYAIDGAEQIGVHGSISPETIDGAELIYANLLDDGEKVRHHPERLAQTILLCAIQEKQLAVSSRQ
jgi:2-phospho-L-lactate transferase/gluconeogenesis factor (CofD/UPF0052 family)